MRAVGGRRGGGLCLPRPRRPLPDLQPPPLRQGHPQQVTQAQCSVVATVLLLSPLLQRVPAGTAPAQRGLARPLLGDGLAFAPQPRILGSQSSHRGRQYLSPVLTVCGPGRPRHQARSSPPPPVGRASRRCSPSRRCPSSPRWCRPWPGHRRWGK